MLDMAAQIADLRAALAASEEELVRARAMASCADAMIKTLKLEIAKLRRKIYGNRSERSSRLLDQMELQLEELEAAATEDAMAAEEASGEDDASVTVKTFARHHSGGRKPFPEHLPRRRVGSRRRRIAPAVAPRACGRLAKTSTRRSKSSPANGR